MSRAAPILSLLILCLLLGLGWAFALGPAPLAAAGPRSDQGLAQPPDVQITIDTVIASGFERPVQVTHAGDGSGRLFVVE
ncbi:MAG: hypothetical protein PVF67_12645, partial [Anaerolineae bacterium]